MSDVDVVVVGAGSAGSAAAITLARRGYHVELVDKATFPRDKCCGDGLTTGCLRRLSALGFDRKEVPSWTPVDVVALASPSGRVAELPLRLRPWGAAAIAPRRELDAALCKLAADAGAHVLEATAFTGVSRRGDGLEVHYANGTSQRARFVIAADGARSTVRGSISDGSSKTPQLRATHEWYAYRAYVQGTSSYAASRMCVWFDETILPGYGWSFPLLGGAANIGFCALRRPGEPGHVLADAWRKTLHHPFLARLAPQAADTAEQVRAWPIPAGLHRSLLSALEGRVLFVGDAARAADPMSGEGIAQALETGVVAGTAILDHTDDHAAARQQYERRLRGTLQSDHFVARCFSAVLTRPLGARAAVRLSGLTGATARSAGRWLFEDLPRSVHFGANDDLEVPSSL